MFWGAMYKLMAWRENCDLVQLLCNRVVNHHATVRVLRAESHELHAKIDELQELNYDLETEVRNLHKQVDLLIASIRNVARESEIKKSDEAYFGQEDK